MSDEITFRITVDREPEWGHWRVCIFTEEGVQYAMTQTNLLDDALRMALPYMACAAEPDPLMAELLGRLGTPPTA